MEVEIKQSGWFYTQKHNLQSSHCVRTEGFYASILAPKFLLAGFREENIFWSLANHKQTQTHLFWKEVFFIHCCFTVWRVDRWKMWAWEGGVQKWVTIAGNKIGKNQHIYGVEWALRIPPEKDNLPLHPELGIQETTTSNSLMKRVWKQTVLQESSFTCWKESIRLFCVPKSWPLCGSNILCPSILFSTNTIFLTAIIESCPYRYLRKIDKKILWIITKSPIFLYALRTCKASQWSKINSEGMLRCSSEVFKCET